jgi:Lrp/AsnC family transcriptional regulator
VIDDIDKKILTIIQKNAGLPLSEISKRVGISFTPCWDRIKKRKRM